MSKTKSTTSNDLPAYRLIFRGKTRGGVAKRAVRIVHVKDAVAAAGYMAENGEKLAKDVGFKVDFCNIFEPCAK